MINLIDSPKRYLLSAFDSSVGVWRFRDNYEDDSGNSNDLRFVGTVGTQRYSTGYTEPNNTSINFDGGATGYLELIAASATDFTMAEEDFSVEFWINHNNVNQYAGVCGKGAYGDGWYIEANGSDHSTRPGGYTFVSSAEILATESYSMGEWHYVAVTKQNSGIAVIYVDGRFVKQMNTLPNSGNTTSTFHLSGPWSIVGKLDEFLIHRGLILDSAQIKERYDARKDLRTFSADSKGVFPYYQKYTTPVTELKISDSVYNVRTYGINAKWSVFANNRYSTSYTGKVDKVKFYYGLGYPETLVNYQSNPQWKVNYTGFFKPPIDGDYTFKLAGSGKADYSIANESTTVTQSNIIKEFDNSDYTSVTVAMLSNSAYAFDFGYEYLKGEDSGFVVLWQTDSASVTPDPIVLSGGVCNPADNNSTPPLLDIPYYDKPKYSVDKDGIAKLKFEVPFIENTTSYGGKGFIHDTTNGYYYDTNNPSVKLKEYKYIEYSEGYRSNNEDETVIKFTGQIREINTKYSDKGDKLEIICNDFSIFTRDAINVQSPTPIDYWQAGYIVEDFGRVNGETKPKTFDGWEPHKVFEVILTECCIDPYSIIQKKEVTNLNGLATTAGFYVEPYGISFGEYLPTNRKYGIAPIGEFDNGNVDEKYAYDIATGEFYQDALNKIFRAWYYKWGVNRLGYPYLTRTHVPSSYVNSNNFSYVGGWEQNKNVSAFQGSYHISTAMGYDTAYVYKNLDGLIDIEGASDGDSIETYRNALTLDVSSASVSDVGTINFNVVDNFSRRPGREVLVNFYSTNDATTYLNATTWPILDSTRVMYGDNPYQFNIDDTAFSRARTLGLEMVVPRSGKFDTLTSLESDSLKYNPTDTTVEVLNGYATTTVTGRKFALLAGRGPSCGSSDPTDKAFRVKLYKNNTVLIDTAINNYDAVDSFYYDSPNSDGLNKSYIPLANGLPYDSYNIKITPLSTSYQTRIEGVLSFAEDYEVPVHTFYTNDSDKKGSITKLDVKKSAKDHRNDVVVLGKRKGTLFQVGKSGEEIAVNPNNDTTIYVQSAVRDLSSIYNASAVSYMGRPKTTIIVDPSILNKSQADFVALNFLKEYGAPQKHPKFQTIGNPLLEVNDCINIKEDWKNGIATTEYAWIEAMTTDIKNTYTTDFTTTPIKPVNSYWKRPAIDLSTYGGNHIWNLRIKNRGIWSKLRSDITTDTALFIDHKMTSTAYSDAISDTGYMRIGKELIKYDYSSVAATYIKFGELSRGLGEDGIIHNHYAPDDVVVGYNPYSYSQGAPTVTFDLLVDANVSVDIRSLKYTKGNLENVPLENTKVDTLTDIEGDLNQTGYEFLPAGHYEFVWGGFDRKGEYNNAVTAYEVDMSEAQFYANHNYNLKYRQSNLGKPVAYGGGTDLLTATVAFGLFYSEVKVIPVGEESSITYSSLGGVSSSYILDSAGINSTIKQTMNDAGTVDLEIFVDSAMRTLTFPGEYSGNDYAYNYNPASDSNRNIGYLKTVDTAANNFPTAYAPGESGNSWTPTYMWNESNVNELGDARGFKWRLLNYSSANHSDINRYYLPTLTYKIVQLAWYQTDVSSEPIKYRQQVTEDLISKHYSENLIFNKNYYFNTKRVLEEEDKEFIPTEAKEDFIANNDFATQGGAPMGVTNYTVFMHTLYDLSGRKPKQRRTYKHKRTKDTNIGSLPSIYADEKRTVNFAAYYHQKIYSDGPSPWYYSGDTANRGMYENNSASQNDTWQVQLGRSHHDIGIKDLTHVRNHVNEFKWHQSAAFFSNRGLYSSVWGTDRQEAHDWGVGRSNFVVWMDENQTKEFLMYDLKQANGYVKDMHNYFWGANFNVPLIWARFIRSDFGDV